MRLGIARDVTLVPLDLLEQSNIIRVLDAVRPDEVYNLAAQSFVPLSFDQPAYTGEVDALGPIRLIEAIRTVCPECRYYQASTSEMFGASNDPVQNEHTPLRPRSPYAAAKAYAHWITAQYREAYGLHASCGILFNHESPLRSPEFVTRKLTLGLARIQRGCDRAIMVGNLDARRDWGFAEDYMLGVWQIVQQPKPNDYVLATGEMHSVRDWASKAADIAGFHLEWVGSGAEERGVDVVTGKTIIEASPKFYRPVDVPSLCGDASKARSRFGWSPKVRFDELIERMMQADMGHEALDGGCVGPE